MQDVQKKIVSFSKEFSLGTLRPLFANAGLLLVVQRMASQAIGETFHFYYFESLAGICIHQGWVEIDCEKNTFFLNTL